MKCPKDGSVLQIKDKPFKHLCCGKCGFKRSLKSGPKNYKKERKDA